MMVMCILDQIMFGGCDGGIVRYFRPWLLFVAERKGGSVEHREGSVSVERRVCFC